MKFFIFSFSWVLFLFLTLNEKEALVTCVDDNVFNGTVSSDWGTAANWSQGCVPGQGTITGTITISANCVVSSTDANNYTFGPTSILIINDGVTFTNNGTGTWTIEVVKGNGTYNGDLTINTKIAPGVDCFEGLHPAFSEFDSDNFNIYLSGNNVVIESNGLANHTSPYWSNTTERCINGPMGLMCTNSNTTQDHPLFVPPTATTFNDMAPGNIDDFNGSYTLTVPKEPQLAGSSSSTGLGPIGMAVSGAMIYNDEEGPNIPLDNAVVSLDYTAAHTGPQSYHYHLEPHAWSNDDGALIGIMSDGFFIYGRRDHDGSYPTDLDASGGHVGPTPHCSEPHYHYHIQNNLFLNQYYIIFPDDYQGTPNPIQ